MELMKSFYWFVHDPTFAPAADGPEETPTGILDLVVSIIQIQAQLLTIL